MKIDVKCFASLSADEGRDGCNYHQATTFDIPERARVKEMLAHLYDDAAAAGVHTVFVNGRQADPDDKLIEGDRIGLFPAVGGM
jgi:molybdopterin converting factor small subunit